MNYFDSKFMFFLNSFAQKSQLFDLAMSSLASNPFLKGGIIISLIWWSWFRPSTTKTLDREFALSGLSAGFVSIVLARALAFALPFRERPMRNPDLHFQIPFGTEPEALIRWSSFPSDHAALFFALSLPLFFVSRRAGIFALLYSFVAVCLSRVYVGIHYPTDILAGALVGAMTAYTMTRTSIRTAISRPVFRFAEKSPGLFYALFFLFTFQFAVNFDHVRYIARGFFSIFSHAS